MMNLFLLHGKTCVQFWHKDLRIAASNSLSGHFENSGGRKMASFFEIKAVFIIFINKNTFVGVNVFQEEILNFP